MPKKNHPVVLLAEDEEFVSQAYEYFLKHEGFEVVCVKNGNDVLSAAMSDKPNIILMDLIMPGLDGFELLKLLKSKPKTKKIPVIVISNLSQQSEIDRCYKLGAVDFVIKSNCSAKDLIQKIKVILKM